VIIKISFLCIKDIASIVDSIVMVVHQERSGSTKDAYPLCPTLDSLSTTYIDLGIKEGVESVDFWIFWIRGVQVDDQV
jgi:hypothetical protein